MLKSDWNKNISFIPSKFKYHNLSYGHYQDTLKGPHFHQIMPALESPGKGNQGVSLPISGCIQKGSPGKAGLYTLCPFKIIYSSIWGWSEWGDRKNPGNFLLSLSFLLSGHFSLLWKYKQGARRSPPNISQRFILQIDLSIWSTRDMLVPWERQSAAWQEDLVYLHETAAPSSPSMPFLHVFSWEVEQLNFVP